MSGEPNSNTDQNVQPARIEGLSVNRYGQFDPLIAGPLNCAYDETANILYVIDAGLNALHCFTLSADGEFTRVFTASSQNLQKHSETPHPTTQIIPFNGLFDITVATVKGNQFILVTEYTGKSIKSLRLTWDKRSRKYGFELFHSLEMGKCRGICWNKDQELGYVVDDGRKMISIIQVDTLGEIKVVSEFGKFNNPRNVCYDNNRKVLCVSDVADEPDFDQLYLYKMFGKYGIEKIIPWPHQIKCNGMYFEETRGLLLASGSNDNLVKVFKWDDRGGIYRHDSLGVGYLSGPQGLCVASQLGFVIVCENRRIHLFK